MIRLEVIDQITGQLKELDTFGNENINLTLQVDDVRDIESKQASYSKDFDLPATKRNNKFFEHYYNLDRYNASFNPYKNVKAFLYVGEVLVLEGFLRLNNVVDKSTEISYNVVLFNDVANVIETLGDSTIEHLNFDDINHVFNTTNIENSWIDNAVVLNEGGTTNVAYYPLINDGFISLDGTNLNVDINKHFILNIQLKYLIDKIFAFAGFGYNSTFLDGDLFKDIFFDIGDHDTCSDSDENDAIVIVADTGQGTDSIGVNNGTNVGTTIFDATAINFANETGDDNSNFNQATSTFTATENTTLNIDYSVTIGNTDETDTAEVVLYANISGGDNIALGSNFIAPIGIDYGDGQNPTVIVSEATYTGSIFLEQGQSVTFEFICLNTSQTMIYNTFVNPPTLTLTVLETSVDCKIKAHRGDIKLADVLKDVVKMFNLTIESLGNNQLRIEPYNNYLSTTVIDWSKKIDVNELVIEPIETPKRIEFRHAEDEDDYYHSLYRFENGAEYGTQVIEFDVDSQDIIEIGLEVFAAPFIKELNGTNINLQHIATQDGDVLKQFENKPRLIYKNLQGFSSGLNINDLNSGIIFDNAPIINNGTNFEGSTDNNPPIPQLVLGDTSLLFGYTNPIYTPTLVTQPLNTLYVQYWSRYINEKYSNSNGLLLKAEIYLKPSDIYSFDFSNIVRIQEQTFRVNKIEYNSDYNTLSKVELIRI
tara:strand:+ start:2283 stop:4406 length:2124 start_codon:yes stop_codon:yes gene_type:complete